MAKILIVGGGFSGVIAAESLVKKLGDEHEITLVSRSREFLFYPALVRLAFGQCAPEDISFNLRDTTLDRRVRFVQGEVARINPRERRVTFAHGDLVGEMPFDFLVVTLGRRLATERIPGFFEHAHHLLSLNAAKKFGKALESFHRGRAVIGHCPGARLPVPVFETAFALSRVLEKRGKRSRCRITIVSNEAPDQMFAGAPISAALNAALEAHGIELLSGFNIREAKPNSIIFEDGQTLECDLRMLLPPFRGPAALLGLGITDEEDYIDVNHNMRVPGLEQVYAAGDCTSFPGPKMGHMAVRQAEVVVDNLSAEIEGRAPAAVYDHEMMLVLAIGENESVFLRKKLWTDEPADIQQSRFWGWAKRTQEVYWKAKHA
jgi:sulfide:quinone oxidoreductase